jgi:uncharacterized membrane protein YjjP (DUF1212 family)/uncharacterized membrane protein YjjB (DUF3815 family)
MPHSQSADISIVESPSSCSIVKIESTTDVSSLLPGGAEDHKEEYVIVKHELLQDVQSDSYIAKQMPMIEEEEIIQEDLPSFDLRTKLDGIDGPESDYSVINVENIELDRPSTRIEVLKNMMMSDLSSAAHVTPFSGITTRRTVILPSEYDTIKTLAMKNLKDERVAKFETWKRKAQRAKDGLSKSLSVENLTQSIDNITKSWQTKGNMFKQLKSMCLTCLGSSIQKEKLYEVRKEDINEVKSIIIDIGYALAIYGMTSYRLEYHLALIASYYDLHCTAYSTPTGLWFCFGNCVDDPNHSSYFVKINSSSLNLSKLCQLDDVADKISRGACSIKEARTMITNILEQQSEYSHFMFKIVSCFIQAGMWSIIFGANWGEMVASFIAGLFIGISAVIFGRYEAFSQIHTIISGIIAGIVALGFKLVFRNIISISVFLVSLSGVVSLLPGLTFTLAIAELSARHLMSGTTRLMNGFVVIIQLGFGILISDRFSKFVVHRINTLPELLTTDRTSPPAYVLVLIIPVVTCTTIVNFKAPKYPLAIIFIMIDAFAGFFASYACTTYFGREVGTLIGAFCVGMVANLFGWVSRHPGVVVSACGIIYLVPGSFGIRSIGAFLQKDSFGGLSFIMDTFSTCVSLTVGLLLADILAAKRKKLQL